MAEATDAAWGGTRPRSEQVQRFKRLVDSNTALGFSDNLQRSRYVSTPVIQAIERCEGGGVVSVAYVPSALGKTTAAYYFLRKHKARVRGIAICRKATGTPYVTAMLHLLGLSLSSPPNWWLTCLIDALQEKDGDGRSSYLILDEFVNEVADRVDSSLLEGIESLIRNTEIRVIVLTPSNSNADFLLTRNNLVGIVPLQGTFPVAQFPNGQWESMTWPVETLKIAARHDPLLATVSEQAEQQIDILLGTLTATQRQRLTNVEVVRELQQALYPQSTLMMQLDVTKSYSLPDEDEENQWCTVCVIC